MRKQTVTANFAGRLRRESLDGREHIVAPLSLINPGVLNGSRGPLYYPPDEIAKTVNDWENIPIVVYHPEDPSGKHLSANDPGVLDRQGIGVIRKPTSNGRLRAEGWFDIERMKKVDPRILAALEAGTPIELSTGLYTENEPSIGHYNGRSYTHVARNYRPDHLAILPDKVGACSIADGCGVLVNAKKSSGANCGTGAGGFKSGNKCAVGGNKPTVAVTPQKGSDILADAIADSDYINTEPLAEWLKTVKNTASYSKVADAYSPENNSPEAVADKIQRSWSGYTAPGQSYDPAKSALVFQVAAQEEFGLSPAGTNHFRKSIPESLDAAVNLYSDAPDVYKGILRSQYNASQKWFNDRGITELEVFRGESSKIIGGKKNTQPISSWTVDSGAAAQFGTVTKKVVPISQVLSTSMTGMGDRSEFEVLLLGSPQTKNEELMLGNAKKSGGANCGTGAGGFKPGNKCGGGGANGPATSYKEAAGEALTLSGKAIAESENAGGDNLSTSLRQQLKAVADKKHTLSAAGHEQVAKSHDQIAKSHLNKANILDRQHSNLVAEDFGEEFMPADIHREAASKHLLAADQHRVAIKLKNPTTNRETPTALKTGMTDNAKKSGGANCGTGAGGFKPSNTCAVGGKGGGKTHSVKLPANKKKLNLGTAEEALKQLGYSLGDSSFSPGYKDTYYEVTSPDGKKSKWTTDEIKDLVYKTAVHNMGMAINTKKSVEFNLRPTANICNKETTMPLKAEMVENAKKSGGANCGTGSGGFKPGNKCAVGGGSGSSGGGDTQSQLKSLAEKHGGKVFKPYKEGGDTITEIEFKSKSQSPAGRNRAGKAYQKFTAEARKAGLDVEQGGEMEYGRFVASLVELGADTTTNQETPMVLSPTHRAKIVDNLIANCSCEGKKIDAPAPWKEDDREGLEMLPDDQLTALDENRKTLAKAKATENQLLAANAEKAKPMTPADWEANAPPEYKRLIANARAEESRRKQDYIRIITGNSKNKFSVEQLAAMDVDALAPIAELAAPETTVVQPANYFGAAAPIGNRRGENFAQEDLDMDTPVLDWKAIANSKN